MDILSVNKLCKNYADFSLKEVSFNLEPGYIMGFIGRNGAGKTTTLKAILSLISRDGGQVSILGEDTVTQEKFCRENTGVVFGQFDYYKTKKLKTITGVVKEFYPEWSEKTYQDYMELFRLNENKKVSELSAGMRVKYSLALALSHNAKLLILDEPTSGLDPVSRDELMDIFKNTVADGERSILFSTHITSDIEKCSDYITYIKEGKIVRSADRETFLSGYSLINGSLDMLNEEGFKSKLIGCKTNAFGFTALVDSSLLSSFGAVQSAPATIDDIMIYTEKEAI